MDIGPGRIVNNFIDPNKIYKPAWENGNLTYNSRNDGTYKIDNNGTLDHLYEQIDELFKGDEKNGDL